MAAPTTLLQFRTARREQIAQDQSAARDRFRRLQQDLAGVRQALQNSAAQVTQLDVRAAAIRAQLPEAPTLADGEALLAELEAVTIQARAIRAGQLQNGLRMETLEAGAKAAAASLQELDAALADAKVAEDAARLRAQKIARDTAALTAAPLAGIQARATAALAGTGAAEARVEADIPVALLTRGRERRLQAAALLTAREAALIAADDLGPGKVAAAVTRAEAALTYYAAQAAGVLTQAEANLARIAAPSTAPLTAAQRARIADETLVADGTAAAAKEKDAGDAAAALDARQQALDFEILKARTVDPDTDPATDPAVIAALEARDTAQTAHGTAQAAYTAAMRAVLSKWEAAVPAEIWRMADDLEESKAGLTWLRDTDPATLSADLANSEAAWAAALFADDTAARVRKILAEERNTRAAALAAEAGVNRHRRHVAMRGDREGA
ncbi:MAG: hypothetical protein IT162_19195 [Bryobacterales bacterium]|nr:hypothetical protein [Bryobacterales bacterium]